MIICCGEALIDMLPRTSTNGEDAFAPYAGGAVFNTALALGPAGDGHQLLHRPVERHVRRYPA
jgi:sugar/nucleoside kinase (ribokinase family)